MSKQFMAKMPVSVPRRELSDNPVKLCNEIARIFRARMREDCEIDGVMSQPGARLVLSVLAIEDGKSQRELVERTHLRAPSVSTIVKKMVEVGMVELKHDEKDLRVNRLYLTDFGKTVDRQMIERIKRVDARGLEGLSKEENETLMCLLTKIRDNLLNDEKGEGTK
ncbi:MAG: winged helix-turn-helix transcriptional regulator [Clostridia bacterium]|nr:winged helix-turn-helix transcriptional regulator [Clostridia bacterium]